MKNYPKNKGENSKKKIRSTVPKTVGRIFLWNFPLVVPRELRGFALTSDLFLDLPMGEQVLVAATRALPRSFYGICAALMEHLHDKVAMKTHSRVAQD
jgi:hypothetical protein